MIMNKNYTWIENHAMSNVSHCLSCGIHVYVLVVKKATVKQKQVIYQQL